MHTLQRTQMAPQRASSASTALLAIAGVVAAGAAGCAQQHPPPARIGSAEPEELTVDAPSRCIEPERSTSVLEVASSSGHLPPEKIRDVMRRQQASVSDCFEAGLDRHPGFRGKVTLLFAIEPDGSVSDTSVVQSDLADCEVVKCLRAHFAGLSFPQPEGGAVMVQYPISVASQAPPQAATASRP